MVEEGGRRALGRGLAALIGDVEGEAEILDRARSGRRLPIEFLSPNPNNPRKSFPAADLDALAASVGERGVVQPILVRPAAGQRGRYEIIAGERRWRAAQRAGLHEVPVIVHDVSDKESLELAIVENVQRSDLNPLEEAAGYRQLMDSFGYSQTEIAGAIGKSRPHVANMIRLLKLPEAVQSYLREGKLTAGHARALIGAADPEAAAAQIVESGLTVRDAESITGGESKPRKRRARASKDADTMALEKALSDAIGLKVSIDHGSNGAGDLRIRYLNLEQLDDVCRRLQF
ncbi:MAG: ParB/RepB/Spo0J family partition protein [Alphaproteobacteria bacterium]